jgi:hypothetical protein
MEMGKVALPLDYVHQTFLGWDQQLAVPVLTTCWGCSSSSAISHSKITSAGAIVKQWNDKMY